MFVYALQCLTNRKYQGTREHTKNRPTTHERDKVKSEHKVQMFSGRVYEQWGDVCK